MNKPYIVCYMMTSVDGRIDCAMTSQLNGVENYYEILDKLNINSSISGRITAELELALPGKFSSKTYTKVQKNCFSKKVDSNGYDIIMDTNGCLLWNDDKEYDKPHIIVTSKKVSQEYLAYLDSKNISWIVSGNEELDLNNVCEILYNEFAIKRLGIVGGAKINTSFLKAKLIDEIVILIGAGIDGRKNYPTLFDGLDENSNIIPLKLKDVKQLKNDAILISYLVNNDNNN